MLGDFINRILILILGYAYPAFECYKTLEKNKVDNEELLFWCKYWIIMAQFTVLEKFTDIFIGWLPMYGFMKLVLFVYLWYPKTKGTGYVYETVLGPYVSRVISHEHEIDMKLLEWKGRGLDYVMYYGHYCAKFWHSAFVKALQHLASQSTTGSSPNPTTEKSKAEGQSVPEAPPNQTQSSFMKQSRTLSKTKNCLPPRPHSETQNSQTVEVHHVSQTEEEEEENPWETKFITIHGQD